MAVLQAAPQAGCVQGPIQPVFSAAASLMFIPGADVKLPSAEKEREGWGGWGGSSGAASFFCCTSVPLQSDARQKKRHVLI